MSTNSIATGKVRRRLAQIWIAAAFVAAISWSSATHAQPLDVAHSRPIATAIVDGSAISFVVRFCRPIDHYRSQLTLVMPRRTRMLRARLSSRPNTLFTAVGALPPGTYELQWVAIVADGSPSRGAIHFIVSTADDAHRRVGAVCVQTMTVGNIP